MRIYNSLGREYSDLPPPPRALGLYVCGITPYDSPHAGHARAAVVFDAFVKYLRASGRTVKYVRNITDVDDKIIQRAGENTGPLVEKHLREYDEMTRALGCAAPDHEPRVSDHIPEIVEMIRELVSRGAAYAAEGSVYFSVASFSEYGNLSNRNTDDMIAGARVEAAAEKRHPLDFALWKAFRKGEPKWASPWGEGRPGWHIECSAMARKYLGDHFDVHGGGLDLIFPHHENERAQSKSACGCEPAAIWMHNGLITLRNVKMSKSLGNVLGVPVLLEKWGPRILRYFLLSVQYSSPVDIADERIDEARRALERFEVLGSRLGAGPIEGGGDGSIVAEFRKALDEDFNTPRAFGILFEAVRKAHKEPLEAAGKIAREIAFCGNLLGIEIFPARGRDAEIEALVAERDNARARKDFARSDEIRNSLAERGIILEDTPKGTVWRRK